MVVGIQQQLKFPGFYRGKVLKHLSKGKMKVFVYGVFNDEYDSYEESDSLPDCEIAAPLFGGNNRGNGMFSYPNLGTIVWVFFQNGDQNYPVCFACTQGDLGVDQYGQVTLDSSDTAREEGEDCLLHVINSNCSRVEIYESGQIKITTFKDSTNKNETKAVVDINGQSGLINIQSTDQINVSTPVLYIKESEQIQVNTNVLKLRASEKIELNTEHLVVTVDNDIRTTAKMIQNTASQEFGITSRSISLDSREGSTTIRSKQQSPFMRT